MKATGGLRGGVGIFGLFTLGFGTIVGVGWITVLGALVAAGGPVGAPLAFALAAIALLPVGLCYAEVGAMLPATGGEAAYALELFGKSAAFVVGWLLVLVFTAVVAFEAISVGWLSEAIVPALGGPVAYELAGHSVRVGNLAVGLAAMAIIGWLNWRGAGAAAKFQDGLTLLLIAVSAVFIGAGLLTGDPANLRPAFPANVNPLHALGAALAITPFFYAGFNTIPQALGESVGSTTLSSLGRAMIATILGAGVFYVLVILSASISVPQEKFMAADLPAAAAFEAALGSPRWAQLVLAAGWLGLVTTWNAVLFAAARALFTLGQIGVLPAWFGQVHPRHGSPGNAVLFVAVVGTLLMLAGRGAVMPIVSSTAAIFSAMFIFTSIAFVVLRRRVPAAHRPYRAPGGAVTPLLAILVSVAMLGLALRESWVGMDETALLPKEWWVIGAWMAFGVLMRHARGRG